MRYVVCSIHVITLEMPAHYTELGCSDAYIFIHPFPNHRAVALASVYDILLCYLPNPFFPCRWEPSFGSCCASSQNFLWFPVFSCIEWNSHLSGVRKSEHKGNYIWGMSKQRFSPYKLCFYNDDASTNASLSSTANLSNFCDPALIRKETSKVVRAVTSAGKQGDFTQRQIQVCLLLTLVDTSWFQSCWDCLKFRRWVLWLGLKYVWSLL